MDDYLQCSNHAYLAVLRAENMQQLKWVICPPEEGSKEKKPMSE